MPPPTTTTRAFVFIRSAVFDWDFDHNKLIDRRRTIQYFATFGHKFLIRGLCDPNSPSRRSADPDLAASIRGGRPDLQFCRRGSGTEPDLRRHQLSNTGAR